jgi:adenosylcobinamide amidohydrolase
VLPDLAYHADLPLLVWRLAAPMLAVSSAPLGGGIGPRHWVLNATVPGSYARVDPDAHLAALAADLGLDRPGVGLLTAVDVAGREVAADGGVTVVATVGLGHPTRAAGPGTINIVAFVPVRLSPAALVNTVVTVTEATAQARADLGVPATGTASDAVCVLCAPDGPAEPFGGPRSTWGARLARATHRAVRDGGAAYLT